MRGRSKIMVIRGRSNIYGNKGKSKCMARVSDKCPGIRGKTKIV